MINIAININYKLHLLQVFLYVFFYSILTMNSAPICRLQWLIKSNMWHNKPKIKNGTTMQVKWNQEYYCMVVHTYMTSN